MIDMIPVYMNFRDFVSFQSVNEESLKILHEYVAALKTHQSLTRQPIDLVFYIRDPNNQRSKLDKYNKRYWFTLRKPIY